jgi:putative aldouronate transport system substrate-binding protein
MKKSIRALALGLATTSVFALASLTGSASGSAAIKNAKTPITVTVWTASSNTALTNNRMSKMVQKEFGITFKTDMLVGDLQTKVGTMTAGGIYDDVLFYNEAFVKANAMEPLDSYLKNKKTYPNLYKQYSPYFVKMKDPNHGMHMYYMVPQCGRVGTKDTNFFPNGTAFWIQKAVLKWGGYPKLKTPAQYFALIEKYKKAHPKINGKTTIGFDILADKNKMYSLINAPEFLEGHPNDGNVVVEKKGSSYKARLFLDDASSKQYFSLLNTEYRKGIVDPEAFTQNYDQYVAKIATGAVLGINDQEWSFGSAVTSLQAAKMDWNTYVGLDLTWSGKGGEYLDRSDATINLANGYGLSKTCKNKARVMEFFNAFDSRKWQDLNQWGVKNVDYKVNSKGQYYRTPAQRSAQVDLNTWGYKNTLKSFADNAPHLLGTYKDGNGTSASSQQSEWYAGLSTVDKTVLKAYKVNSWEDLYAKPVVQPPYYPCWQISVDSGSAANTELQKVWDLAFENLPKCISSTSASGFASGWSDYVGQIHKSPVSDYLKVEQAGIDYRMKTWKSFKSPTEVWN